MPALPIESQPDLAPIANAAAIISAATAKPMVAELARRVSPALGS
jgi:hypothetical protein